MRLHPFSKSNSFAQTAVHPAAQAACGSFSAPTQGVWGGSGNTHAAEAIAAGSWDVGDAFGASDDEQAATISTNRPSPPDFITNSV